MQEIDVIGFDYHHTICNYTEVELDHFLVSLSLNFISLLNKSHDECAIKIGKQKVNKLIYDLAKDHLITALRYPKELQKVEYDYNFAIRGLMFDRSTGLILKMNYLNNITSSAVYLV